MRQFFILTILCLSLTAGAQPSPTAQKMARLGFVDIQQQDTSIHVSLMYSRPDNFTGRILYADLREAYLHPKAARALLRAQQLLRAQRPELSLKVYDAARPMHIQQKMWDTVKGTAQQNYVSNPRNGGSGARGAHRQRGCSGTARHHQHAGAGQPAAASQGNETGRIHALALGVVALQPGVPSRGTRPLSRDTIAGVSAARWTSGYGCNLFFTHYFSTNETTRREPRSNVPRWLMQHAVPTHATRCMSHENRVFPCKGHEAPKNVKFWSAEYQMISIAPVHSSCQNGAKKGHFCHILGWSARSVNSGKGTIYLQFRNTSIPHGQKHQRRPHGRL